MAGQTTGERGDLFRISVAFTNSAGVATDPTTVTHVMVEPDGVITTVVYPTTIVKDSTGNYHLDWTAGKDTEHHSYFQGAGTVQRTLHQVFYVNPRLY